MSGTVKLLIDGQQVEAAADEMLGAVLYRRGAPLRLSPRQAQPRSLFCGMGVCFECAVRVDGNEQIRACITAVRDGMMVETGFEG
jgi:sarcosine oxidase subunit alpha